MSFLRHKGQGQQTPNDDAVKVASGLITKPYTERTVDMLTLTAAGRGTLIGLGRNSRVEILADWPVDIFVNRGPEPISLVTYADLPTQVSQVEIRATIAVPGRLVIREWFPDTSGLGRKMVHECATRSDESALSGNWAAGAAPYTSAVAFTPGLSPVGNSGTILHGLFARRTAGTINTVTLLAADLVTALWSEPFIAAATVKLTLPQSIKIGSAFAVQLVGSNEAGATTATVYVNLSTQ